MLRAIYEEGCRAHAELALSFSNFQEEVIRRYYQSCARRARGGLSDPITHQRKLLTAPRRASDLMLCIACTLGTPEAWERLIAAYPLVSIANQRKALRYFGDLMASANKRPPEGAVANYTGNGELAAYLALGLVGQRKTRKRSERRARKRDKQIGSLRFLRAESDTESFPSEDIHAEWRLTEDEQRAWASGALARWNRQKQRHRTALRDLVAGKSVAEAARHAGMTGAAVKWMSLRFRKKLLGLLPSERIVRMTKKERWATGRDLCKLVVELAELDAGGGV